MKITKRELRNLIKEQLTSNYKKDIKEFKKQLGVGYVKMKVNHYRDRIYGRILGIKGGSVGPMTVTDQHMNFNYEIENKIIDFVGNENVLKHIRGSEIHFLLNGKKYKMIWDAFPTYAGNQYDDSYETFWLIFF